MALATRPAARGKLFAAALVTAALLGAPTTAAAQTPPDREPDLYPVMRNCLVFEDDSFQCGLFRFVPADESLSPTGDFWEFVPGSPVIRGCLPPLPPRTESGCGLPSARIVADPYADPISDQP